MSYICYDCNNDFSTPKKYYNEQLECHGQPCREEYLGCPYCGGAYTSTHECDEECCLRKMEDADKDEF